MARPTRKHTPPERTPLWEPTDWQCVGILTVLVGLFFLPLLFGRAYLWEDFVYQWYPFRQFAASALAQGEIPLWNPYTFNGMPFLAEIQTEVFYLPMTLLTLFVRDGRLEVFWLQLVNILHYWLAGVGMFLLTRSYSLRRIPSLFAGIVYAFSGFMVVHGIHQVILVLVAWFPLILWLFRKSFSTTGWSWVCIAGLALGHSFFGGSPQMSLFLYLFLFCYVVFELVSIDGVRGLAQRPALILAAKAAVIVGISAGIAMIQFSPTQELSALSARAQITYEKAAEGSLAWVQLATLLVPKLFGVSDAHGYAYWGPGAYWYYWETCIYMGILPLLFSVFALWVLRGNRHVVFFGAVALVALLYALGGNFILHRLFFEGVPGFASFRNPARMGVFIAFSGAVLSAFLLHRLGEQDAARYVARYRRVFLVIAAGAILILLLLLTGFLTAAVEPPVQPQARASAHQEVLLSAFLVLLSIGVLWLFITRAWKPHWLGLLACLLVFLDLYRFGANHNTSPDNPADHFRRAESIVRFIQQQDGIFRVNTRNSDGMVMDRNQGLVDRIFTSEGYTPLVLQRVYPPTATDEQLRDLLNIRFFTETDRDRHTLTLRERPGFLQRAFLVFQTHTVHSEEELSAFLRSSQFDPRRVAVLEEEPHVQLRNNVDSSRWRADITEYHHNAITIHVETEQPGMLVVSEAWFPGWNAYLNGIQSPVYRTDFSLRGVFVSAGTTTVELRYEPASFARGATITLTTLGICLCVLAVPLARRVFPKSNQAMT
jgi:hypothetical protein